jgi:hypothetical protein
MVTPYRLNVGKNAGGWKEKTALPDTLPESTCESNGRFGVRRLGVSGLAVQRGGLSPAKAGPSLAPLPPTRTIPMGYAPNP